MNDKQMRKADFITSAVLIVFGSTVVVMSFNMPRLEEKGINPYTAPGVVPGILGVIILLLALIMFLRTIKRGNFLPDLRGSRLRAAVTDEGIIRLIAALGLCLIYALGFIGRIPYALATFLFIAAFILVFDLKLDASAYSRKRIITLALIQAFITSAVVSAAFQYLFLVDLP